MIAGKVLFGGGLNAVSVMSFPIAENYSPRCDLRSALRLGWIVSCSSKCLILFNRNLAVTLLLVLVDGKFLPNIFHWSMEGLVTTQCYWNILNTAFPNYQIASRWIKVLVFEPINCVSCRHIYRPASTVVLQVLLLRCSHGKHGVGLEQKLA